MGTHQMLGTLLLCCLFAWQISSLEIPRSEEHHFSKRWTQRPKCETRPKIVTKYGCYELVKPIETTTCKSHRAVCRRSAYSRGRCVDVPRFRLVGVRVRCKDEDCPVVEAKIWFTKCACVKPRPPYDDKVCDKMNGECQSTSIPCEGGQYFKGRCIGSPKRRQCCVRCVEKTQSIEDYYGTCRLERATNRPCVAIYDCPTDCKDSMGQRRRPGDTWEEPGSGVLPNKCTCFTGNSAFPPLLPPGLPPIPPRVVCHLKGCKRLDGTEMAIDETFYRPEANGGMSLCTCVDESDPLIYDDAPPTHISCKPVANNDDKCEEANGHCQDKTKFECEQGEYFPGYCALPPARQCCMRCVEKTQPIEYYYGPCRLESAPDRQCVSIHDCPTDCKDSTGQRRNKGDTWEELGSGGLPNECTCHAGNSAFPPLLPPGLPPRPPRADCHLLGCERLNDTVMAIDETFYRPEANGGMSLCTCVNKPNPLIHDDAPPTHISCKPAEFHDEECKEKQGVCQDTSEPCARGEYDPEGCDGPESRQCCQQAYDDSKCEAKKGECQDKTKKKCEGGKYVPKCCDGPANRQCCVPYDDSKCEAKKGKCQDKTKKKCEGGTYVPKCCDGPANRQCCVPYKDEKCKEKGGECLDTTKKKCKDGVFDKGCCDGPAKRQCCVVLKFKDMWDKYPHPDDYNQTKLWELVCMDDLGNTCAARISYMFYQLGLKIEIKKGECNWAKYKNTKGQKYIVRCATWHCYLEKIFKKPMCFKNQKELEDSGKKGFITFQDCEFETANGHIDLWDGKKCKNQCYFDECKKICVFEVTK